MAFLMDVLQVVEMVASRAASMAEMKAALKAETKVVLMAALLVASKACWTEFLPVAETAVLKVAMWDSSMVA